MSTLHSSKAVAADIAILGAGCAGLSLATALLDAGEQRRIVLIDSRQQYTRDHSWCFWATDRHPFEDCVSHSWQQWSVGCKGATIIRGSTRYPYQHIPADRFYTAALSRIGKSPNCNLLLGTNVSGVVAQDYRLLISTDKGSLTSRQAFNSLAHLAPHVPPPVFWQRFVGWHVRTEVPVFDPSTVGLMHFDDSNSKTATNFLYILPFSRKEALVESTYFEEAGATPANAEQDLLHWLQPRTPYQILYRERGSLPMGSPVPASALPGVTNIGIVGGRLKPSTGYGFLRIQRHSAALARQVAHQQYRWPLPLHLESSRYSLLDRVFLEALRRQPQRAPDYFTRLFQVCRPDHLVRFLSECGSLTHDLRIALGMPWTPFLTAALRTCFSRRPTLLRSNA